MIANPNIGRILENKYEIVRILGEGGMGEVYEAHHKLINRRLAIKLLHNEYARDLEVVRRFRQEATTTASIGHDHIVDITDMGVTDKDEIFIVMEFLDGQDLETMLKREKRLSPERASHIMIQVLSALESTHAKQIIHRDLKPANIFLIKNRNIEDYVKLVDFGISKVRCTEDGLTKGLTRTGAFLGTPMYMSPEQAMGEIKLTPATDIYSAGTILYEMLAGSPPFDRSTLPALLLKIINEKPVNLRTKNRDISPDLANTVMKALEKDPSQRIADAATFRRSILSLSPNTPILAGLEITRYSDFAGSPVGGSTTTPFDFVSSQVREKKSRWPIAAAIFGIITVISIAALVAILKPFGIGAGRNHVVIPLITANNPLPVGATVAPESLVPKQQLKPEAKDPEVKADTTRTKTSSIRFSASIFPSYAVVLIDGKTLGRGSQRVRLPSDNMEHEVVVKAAGFVTHSLKLFLTNDIDIKITLERASQRQAKENHNSAAVIPEPAKQKNDTEKAAKTPGTAEEKESGEPATGPEIKIEPIETQPKVIEKGQRTVDEDLPW